MEEPQEEQEAPAEPVLTQPTFAWTDRDRALLVPGVTLVVYRLDTYTKCVRAMLIKVVRSHRDHVFHERTVPNLMGAADRLYVAEELAHCDPTSLPGYVAEQPVDSN